MDIQNIKFAQELVKNKIRIQKELNMVNVALDELKKGCNHLYVSLSEEPKVVSKCLFCEDEIIDNNEIAKVNAIYYKQGRYSKGYNSEQREGKLRALQDIVIGYLEENANINQEEIITNLNKKIEEDQENYKAQEKRI